MMSEKDIIVHFIARDKFTAGYIDFFKLRMPEYEHYFFTGALDVPLNICNNDNVYYYQNLSRIFLNPETRKLIRQCRKIIYSGVHASWKRKIFFMLSGLVSKTYLHFWGGDFYGYRSVHYTFRHPRRTWNKLLHHMLIRMCAGTISLIDSDIEELCRVFPNHTKHFVAPMGGSPLRKINFSEIRQRHSQQNHTPRITIGNSAFPENQHIEALRVLGHLKNENIEIICSLSYGSDDHREKVIEEGKKIFGDKFIPVLDFMSFEEYVNLLASCDVGIFNNNRQQGMGNISILLRLGKKVYIREDTAMWKHYTQNMKYTMYPVSELENITLQELINFPEELAYNNIQIAEERAASNYAVEQWRKVFED